jgi:hypothetical protein
LKILHRKTGTREEVLDQLSGNWHILVYNDYEAVMPVPLKENLL